MNDLPPCDLAAEQRLLGHFVDPLHALIFAAILERVEAGQLVDAVVLRDVFAGTQVLEEVGGAVYLTQLITAVDVDGQSTVGHSPSRIDGTFAQRRRAGAALNTYPGCASKPRSHEGDRSVGLGSVVSPRS